MNTVNYLLLFKGYSNQGGCEFSVRGFITLEAAQTAMIESHKKFEAYMNIPVGPNESSNKHTTRTKNSIYLKCNDAWFQWEIIKAVPEDGEADGISRRAKSKRRRGLVRYTVTIEEHIAQDFSIEAFDIFAAVQSAEASYKHGSLVVQPSTPNTRLIMARDEETGEITEWKEF